MTNATAQRTVTTSPGAGVELEPEVMLPSQFHIREGRSTPPSSPRSVSCSRCMEDAVGTFQKYVLCP